MKGRSTKIGRFMRMSQEGLPVNVNRIMRILSVNLIEMQMHHSSQRKNTTIPDFEKIFILGYHIYYVRD